MFKQLKININKDIIQNDPVIMGKKISGMKIFLAQFDKELSHLESFIRKYCDITGKKKVVKEEKLKTYKAAIAELQEKLTERENNSEKKEGPDARSLSDVTDFYLNIHKDEDMKLLKGIFEDYSDFHERLIKACDHQSEKSDHLIKDKRGRVIDTRNYTYDDFMKKEKIQCLECKECMTELKEDIIELTNMGARTFKAFKFNIIDLFYGVLSDENGNSHSFETLFENLKHKLSETDYTGVLVLIKMIFKLTIRMMATIGNINQNIAFPPFTKESAKKRVETLLNNVKRIPKVSRERKSLKLISTGVDKLCRNLPKYYKIQMENNVDIFTAIVIDNGTSEDFSTSEKGAVKKLFRVIMAASGDAGVSSKKLEGILGVYETINSEKKTK